MTDRHEIDTQRRIIGINCKRWVTRGYRHVEKGCRVEANAVNAHIADLLDDKCERIQKAGIAIAA